MLTDDQMIKSQQQIMSFGRSLYIDGIFPPNRSLIYIIIGLKSEYSKKFNRWYIWIYHMYNKYILLVTKI